MNPSTTTTFVFPTVNRLLDTCGVAAMLTAAMHIDAVQIRPQSDTDLAPSNFAVSNSYHLIDFVSDETLTSAADNLFLMLDGEEAPK